MEDVTEEKAEAEASEEEMEAQAEKETVAAETGILRMCT